MLFVFCLDAGFLMPTGVAIRSLDRHLGPDDRIAVLHLGLSSSDTAKLSACITNAQFESYRCDDVVVDRSWVPPEHVSAAAFLRYLAPSFLADDERCVYLDGDVLVRHDPAPLFHCNLQGRTLGAVRSRVTPFIATKGGVGAWMEAGIPGHAPYFNSGVLVLDIQRWLDRDVTRAITNYLVDYGDRANLADQEAVNVAVYGDWVSLDRTWNYVTYVADYFLQEPEAEPSSPCIAHFAGRSKPWSFERPPLFTDEWFEVLTETPWAGFSPENARRRARSKWRRGMRRIGQNFKGR